MCGIAGLLSPVPVSAGAEIAAMTGAIRHRGPDDEGYVAISCDGNATALSGADSQTPGPLAATYPGVANVWLGHRRLAILDLTSAGHQPMASADGFWIVFNGEIYNYVELRAELIAVGHSFRSGTDTEVLLAAYREWGDACTSRLDGMWAFAIYDPRTQRIFASRDRFGVKPLYFRHLHGARALAFASEIKALLPLGRIAVNRRIAWDYLALGHVEHAGETLFDGILKLPAGSSFSFDLRTARFVIKRHYVLAVDESDVPFEPQVASRYAEEVRETVREAVRLRLRADVDVGTCVSGGIDSSVIAVLAAAIRQQQASAAQHLFTATFPGRAADESRYARAVAEATGATWHTVTPEPQDLWQDLRDLVETQEEPFGSTSIYAQYRVMRLAHDVGTRVLLDGQGADELFGGYLPYLGIRQWELLRRGRIVASAAFSHHVARRYSPRLAFAGALRAAAFATLPAPALVGARRIARPSSLRALGRGFRSEHALRGSRYKAVNAALSVNGALHQRVNGVGLQGLLRYEDRNSMRWSIESRTPFADDIRLIELAFKIPSAYKVHSGVPKYLLRRAFDPLLPAAVAMRRDKVGFATPEREWLAALSGHFRALAEEHPDDGVLDLAFVRRALSSPARETHPGNAADTWRIVNYMIWRRTFAHAIV